MSFSTIKTPVEVTEKILLGSFTNSDLVGGSLTITHTYVTKAVDVTVLNPDGTKMVTDGLTIDTSKYNKVVLNLFGDLQTGTFGLIIRFLI
jgi:hypothetical protein